MRPARAQHELEPIYYAHSLLGWVEPTPDGRYEAVSVRGEQLGKFNSRGAAFQGLLLQKAL